MNILLIVFESVGIYDLIFSLRSQPGKLAILSTVSIGPAQYSRSLDHYQELVSRDALETALVALNYPPEQTCLLPVDEAAFRFFAENRPMLSRYGKLCPHSPVAIQKQATHKAELAKLCLAHRIAVPETWFSDTLETIPETAYPVILKQADAAYGHGLSVHDSAETLLAEAKALQVQAKPFIVQHFVEGYDIDCSLFAVDGDIKAWTIQKEVSKQDTFSPPLTVAFVDEPRVLAVVTRLMTLLKWSGVAHIDLRYDAKNDAFLILEINGRFWGSLIASTVAGVNFPEIILGHLEGRTIPTQQTPIRFRRRGIGIEALLTGQLKYHEVMLPYVFRDPKPYLMECIKSLKRP